MKYLLVIDMQNDFISQALGTPEAPGIVEPVCRLIRGFDGDVIYTRDTHRENYLETQEGGKLPVPHCIEGTAGWQICGEVAACMSPGAAVVDKTTFGAYSLPKILLEKSGGEPPEEIHFAGLCTDICVISNAMICKAAFPEASIIVHSDCCAGVTPESHRTALAAMDACQIEIR